MASQSNLLVVELWQETRAPGSNTESGNNNLQCETQDSTHCI